MKTTVDGQKYRFYSRSAAILFSIFLFAMPASALLPTPASKTKTLPGPGGMHPSAIASRPLTAAQRQLANQAEQSGIQVNWNNKLNTPRSIRGRNLGQRRAFSQGKGLTVAAGASAERNAIAVLDNLSGLFMIQDAGREFTAQTPEQDRLGFQHVKVRQTYQGLRVFGGELIVHFNTRGEVYEVNGRYVPDINVNLSPAFDAIQAVILAQNDLSAMGKPAGTVIRAPELVIFAFNSEPRLAYELTLAYDDHTEPGCWRYWIDAQKGDILLRYNNIQTISAPTANGSPATLTGSLLTGEGGGATNVTGWFENTGAYYLYNTSQRWYIYNYAWSGWWDSYTYAYRTNPDWSTSDRTEMSAANNFAIIQTYYSTVHGRNSFNNSNAYARANVHYGSSLVNAYWSSSDQAFLFGDGDGATANELAVLDICGHEFTHAVTEYSAALIYAYESGALNESFSDIFGALIEFAGQPDGRSYYPDKAAGHSDWLIGEDCWLSSTALRDMRNPGSTVTLASGDQQPTRYHGTNWYFGSGDYGGVHYNNSVQSFFFYLLSEGGAGVNDGISYSVTGIGIDNAAQVAYRTLTVYCTPYTDYYDARANWISAATDLNASWVTSVQQAWTAVGIDADTASTALATAVNAPLLTWYTGGPSNWFPQTTTTHDGTNAAQSGVITSNQQTRLYTTVNGPGALSFWWKVSSETNWDYLMFFTDNANQNNISGETDWQSESYTIPSGSHILKWIYIKDMSVSGGSDAGWLDQVTWTPTTTIAASAGTYTDRIVVSWNTRDGTEYYELWRAQALNDTSMAVRMTNTTATTFIDTTATPGITYYYWIKSYTSQGLTDFLCSCSGWRSWLSVPTGVSASDGAYTDKVRVTWTASENAASYNIYRNTTAIDTGATAVGSTTGTTYDDTAATADTTYYYWVEGLDASSHASGFSLPDSGWRATTPTPPDPGWTNPPVLRAIDFQMSPAVMQIGASPSLLSVRIANTATISTSAWVTLTLYLSGNGIFDSVNDLSMGSVRRYLSLAPDQSADIQLTSAERANLRVPGTAALGYYTVFLRGTTPDATGTNNVVALASTVKVIASRLSCRDDFDGDGKTDLAVYYESTGTWVIRSSATGRDSTLLCGGPGYIPVSGDFDNDGKADLAVYHQSIGTWLFRLSGSTYSSATVNNFGGTTYTPVAGDFDGDGKSDPAIHEKASGNWQVMLSAGSYAISTTVLGGPGYVSVSGDFDGDGKADPTVYAVSSGLFTVMLSGNGYVPASVILGGAGCVPVGGDFDADGKSDPAVYQEDIGLWMVMMSASSYAIATTRFGETGFKRVFGDFDGDGKTDLTLYQTGYGYWYFRLSGSSYALSSLLFGGTGYIPIEVGD